MNRDQSQGQDKNGNKLSGEISTRKQKGGPGRQLFDIFIELKFFRPTFVKNFNIPLFVIDWLFSTMAPFLMK